jgi:hypothetical protein
MWRRQGWASSNPVTSFLNQIWLLIFQPLLFGLIGRSDHMEPAIYNVWHWTSCESIIVFFGSGSGFDLFYISFRLRIRLWFVC